MSTHCFHFHQQRTWNESNKLAVSVSTLAELFVILIQVLQSQFRLCTVLLWENNLRMTLSINDRITGLSLRLNSSFVSELVNRISLFQFRLSHNCGSQVIYHSSVNIWFMTRSLLFCQCAECVTSTDWTEIETKMKARFTNKDRKTRRKTTWCIDSGSALWTSRRQNLFVYKMCMYKIVYCTHFYYYYYYHYYYFFLFVFKK